MDKKLNTEILVDSKKYADSQPFKHLNNWDFIVIVAAILFRFLVTINQKAEELQLEDKHFDIKKYFDSKHIIRWITHVFGSFVVILILPELFVELVQKRYFNDIPTWTLFFSATVGYLGYDMLKVFESVYKFIFSKFGMKFSNESK